MARLIASTPKLNEKATIAFLNRVNKDLRKSTTAISTPKIDHVIKRIMRDARKANG